MQRTSTLPALLGGQVVFGAWAALLAGSASSSRKVLAWGLRPSTSRARKLARFFRAPLLFVEDGFLRSYGTGESYPPLSIVTDELGAYYDSTRPSQLERVLNGCGPLTPESMDAARQARSQIAGHRLSKYNHAPSLVHLNVPMAKEVRQRVLVVDQTAGDMSVTLGGATAETFRQMLDAALAENPDATVYVKTHPEVTSGRKTGHFGDLRSEGRIVVLRQAIEPASLIREVDRVYVVSSTMGFEALLAGKPVTCFGVPWYAGWGVTDDRQPCPRRTRRRSVDELFAAAYLDYARYLNPETHDRGTIFHVIEWLARQKYMATWMRGPAGDRRLICIGFRRWKAANLRSILAGALAEVVFVPDAEAARALVPRPDDWLVFWSATPPAGVDALANATGAQTVRLEDGFLRSVGLGSDLIAPRSLVLDTEGIYFDPSCPSRLEVLLNAGDFSAKELADAREVREFIVTHGLTKYNLEPRQAPAWAHGGRRVVLVPGQVEDDASIRLGCRNVRTNLGLLQAARAACPDAFIVYKPHPDVASGNRKGHLPPQEARVWADHIEARSSVVSCIEACDEVHTMTSLAGFDALLRGKHVVVYGQPFYAGWGLTRDVLTPAQAPAFARRRRRLTLDELVAGTLLRYPIYWDPKLNGYTSCIAVLRTLLAERSQLERAGHLERIRTGWLRRQMRKARILFRAWTTP